MRGRLKWDRFIGPLTITAGALLAVPDAARAQHVDGTRAGVFSMQPLAEARRVRVAVTSDSVTPTTRSQRFAVGLGIGVLSAALAGAAGGKDAAFVAYAAGSAAGVMLAGHAREGARPVPALVGAAIGALPLIAAYEAEDVMTGFSAGMAGAIGAPLLAALAHEWGGPRRGARRHGT